MYLQRGFGGDGQAEPGPCVPGLCPSGHGELNKINDINTLTGVGARRGTPFVI